MREVQDIWGMCDVVIMPLGPIAAYLQLAALGAPAALVALVLILAPVWPSSMIALTVLLVVRRLPVLSTGSFGASCGTASTRTARSIGTSSSAGVGSAMGIVSTTASIAKNTRATSAASRAATIY